MFNILENVARNILNGSVCHESESDSWITRQRLPLCEMLEFDPASVDAFDTELATAIMIAIAQASSSFLGLRPRPQV